jgi:phosphotransferase system HPr (HPr) family protein
MLETKITITNKVGLHARPASLFVQVANKCASDITVCNLSTASKPVNAKSIISVLTLGVMQNHEILVQANGSDEEDAIERLKALALSNFGES